jgi:hypothetical protein
MVYHTIDDSNHPIFIIRINPVDPSDEEFDAYIKTTFELVKTVPRGALIFNITKAKFLSSNKRIKIANMFKVHRSLFVNNVAGIVYVNSSFIPMTILKGIFFDQ